MPHKYHSYRLKPLIALAALFLAAFSPSAHATKTLQFAWNPSNDPQVTGYNLSYGTASGNYSQTVNAGPSTSATISGLTDGTTYYFAVRSYNAAGLQSIPSNEVSITVPANLPPVVTLTSPQSGTSWSGLTPMTLTATASDPDGTIAKVEFYDDSNKIGEATSAPYSATWSNAPAGSYLLTALAYDNSGAAVRSAGATVTVTGAGPSPSPTPTPGKKKVRIFSLTPIVSAGGTAKFRIAASDINSTQPMVVNYSMGGTAVGGVDYSASDVPGQITIPVGARGTTLSFRTMAGNGRKTAVVTLQSGSDYDAIGPKATIVIVSR
jgi:Bacterial Ig domain/Fibronectin type III domain